MKRLNVSVVDVVNHLDKGREENRISIPQNMWSAIEEVFERKKASKEPQESETMVAINKCINNNLCLERLSLRC